MKRLMIICFIWLSAITIAYSSGNEDVEASGNEDVEDISFLHSGETISGEIDLNNQYYNDYFIDVPETALGIRLTLSRSPFDLDMNLFFGDDKPGEDDFYYTTESLESVEILEIFRFNSDEFYPGQYRVRVFYPDLDSVPRYFGYRFDGMSLFEFPYEIRYEVFDYTEITQELIPGIPTEASSDYNMGFLSHFTLDIPTDNGFTIDVLESTINIDLYLAMEPVANAENIIFLVDNPHGWERLEYPKMEDSEITRFYLIVSSGADPFFEHDLSLMKSLSYSFKIVANEGMNEIENPPPPPVIPTANDEVDNARLATVQLYLNVDRGGGSGCIVSPDGWIITNEHVSTSFNGDSNDMHAAITLDNNSESEILYIAEFVEKNYEKDLALLKITKDKYGKRLPDDYRFNYWSLEDQKVLKPGDDLMVMGYPVLGRGPFSSYYTLTKGIYSGTTDFLGKTDALIASGTSGGPVFNEDWKLVGIAASSNYDLDGHLSFFVPAKEIPEDWWKLINSTE